MTIQARILSIEDDPEMRGLLQVILERKGHRVVGAKHGELGLEMLRSLNPDVLLLDLMLPDINGWELYHRMKDDAELSKVPVIIISARNQQHDAKNGNMVLGNDRFLQKPFEISDLINTVYDILKTSNQNS